MKKIVAIGGGSGLSTLLRGIRDYPAQITAIVTMTDDGASSGLLRKDLGILPPGDIRKCIAALSEEETLLLNLFQYRFRKGIGLKGHNLGNLLIGAMKDMTGSFESAIEEISDILNIKGQVLPASLTDVHLGAEFENGHRLVGESKITRYGYKNKIKKVYLTKAIKANPKVIEAIKEADLILVGPGSLYTSILPNFLIKDLLKAYLDSKATKIFISNVSTERGETENLGLNAHLEILRKYSVSFDQILANSVKFKEMSGDGYVCPVEIDVEGVIKVPVVDNEEPLFHDAQKLGKEVWKLALKNKKLKSNC